jgi:signal transduction histidine kinase
MSIVVLAFLIPLALVVQHLARERALADAERQTAIVVAVLTVTTDPAAVDRAVATTAPAPGRVAVHGLAGGPVGNSHTRPEDVALAAGQRRPVVAPCPGGLSYLEPVDLGADATAVVEVFVPNPELSRGVRAAWWTLGVVAALLLLASALVNDRLAARVVGSARGLARAARALGDGDLGVRATVAGPRELAEAGLAFNTMADRVSASLTAERELVADLSHRLRTPLTALRLEAEAVEAGRTAPRLREAVDALEREVDALIRTTRAPITPPTAEPETCDAGEVVRERMAFWAAVAEDQGRLYRVSGADRPAPVSLPRSELAAALDALLGNVFRYTPQGTRFEVAVTRRKGYVSVRVEDGGSGIADPQRALRRGTSEQGSTGLGLDIVRRAAVAGNGSVDIGTGSLGGASVVVMLTDAEKPPEAKPRFGFVGRLSSEPGERRWSRRAPR